MRGTWYRGGGTWRVLSCVVAAVWLVQHPVGARTADPPERASRWVSADAVLYAEMPRPAALIDRVGDARFLAVLKSVPGFEAASTSGVPGKLREVAAAVAARLNVTPDALLRGLTGGGMTLAVEALRGQPPGVALIVTPTDPALPRRAGDTLVELARKDAAEHGRPDPVKSGEHRGVTGYALGKGAAFGVVKDRIVLADRGDTIKAVVDRMLDGLPAGGTIEDTPEWAGHASARADALAWGVIRLERLRELDPDRFRLPDRSEGGQTLLFGGWLETVRQAPWVAASLNWGESTLALRVAMPAPQGGMPEPFRGFVPGKGAGAPGLLRVPGEILSMSLWRDLGAVWEARTRLFREEDAENLDKLGTSAGNALGRDFGPEFLNAITPAWRLVIARPDESTLDPLPDLKLPTAAVVAELKSPDADLNRRLKVLFQTVVGRVNTDLIAQGVPPLELQSESVEGTTFHSARFLPPRSAAGAKGDGPVPSVPERYNLTPTLAVVGNRIILSTSVGLARAIAKAETSKPATGAAATLSAEANAAVLAGVIDLNRERIVQQNMREKQHNRGRAEAEVASASALLRYLGQGRLIVSEGNSRCEVTLEFRTGR